MKEQPTTVKLTSKDYEAFASNILDATTSNKKLHNVLTNMVKRQKFHKTDIELLVVEMLEKVKSYSPNNKVLVQYKSIIEKQEVKKAVLPKPKDTKPVPATPKIEEVKQPELKPYEIGAFMLNSKGHICEIIKSDYHTYDESRSNYANVEYLNHNLLEVVEISFYGKDAREWFLDGFDGKNYDAKYLDGSKTIPEPKVKKSIGRLGYKIGKVDITEYSTISKKLKDLESYIKNIGLNVKTDIRELQEANIKKCKEVFGVNLEGFVEDGRARYIPEIYSKVDLIDFCDKNSLLLTSEGIYSIDELPLARLKSKDLEILHLPVELGNIMIMVNLCLELDKPNSAKEAVSMQPRMFNMTGREYKKTFYMVYGEPKINTEFRKTIKFGPEK